jgi:glyoxylase-like metal-dependent hydrolase (beta-lactamase superfamily II)
MNDIASLLTGFPHGVTAIDTLYERPRLDASHLLVHEGRAAFIDTGTTHSVPNLLAALEHQDLRRDQVDYILLTHVHLDHAGGAGKLAQELPSAKVIVHPRGARHLSDPSKLVAGSIAVYGEERFRALYGEIVPIPAARIESFEDGQKLFLGGRELEFIHTPGHAQHHLCIVDPFAKAIFSGDTFGISYRETDTAQGPFIFPTTTPVQFDPPALHASIDRLLAYRPEAIYLTHYSRVTGIEKLGRELHARVDGQVAIARRLAQAPGRTKAMEDAVFDWLCSELAAHGFSASREQCWAIMGGDVKLNVQGLEVWLAKA